MASIRKLKKDINALTFHLLAKSFAIKNYGSGIDDQRFDAIIKKIVFLRNDLVFRANHPEIDAESHSVKEHYLKIKKDLFELMSAFDELKTEKV